MQAPRAVACLRGANAFEHQTHVMVNLVLLVLPQSREQTSVHIGSVPIESRIRTELGSTLVHGPDQLPGCLQELGACIADISVCVVGDEMLNPDTSALWLLERGMDSNRPRLAPTYFKGTSYNRVIANAANRLLYQVTISEQLRPGVVRVPRQFVEVIPNVY